MRTPPRFDSYSFLIVMALVSISAVPAFAGGPGDGAASLKPKPAVEKRIYTNDDLDALAAQSGGPARQIAPTTNSVLVPAAEPSPKIAKLAPLPDDQNPEWYAQQTITLQDELASIEIEIARLQQFRTSATTSSPGVAVGLVLYAHCGGITTDNQIDRLVSRRNQIALQLDALADTARANVFPPGMLRHSEEILQAAQTREVVTPEQRQAIIVAKVQTLSAHLGNLQETLGSIDQQAAAQNITLLPVTPGYGGNMTTNYLQGTANQASELQQKISDIQDEARVNGIPPGALR